MSAFVVRPSHTDIGGLLCAPPRVYCGAVYLIIEICRFDYICHSFRFWLPARCILVMYVCRAVCFQWCTFCWFSGFMNIWSLFQAGYGRRDWTLTHFYPLFSTQVFRPWCETCRVIQQQFWMKECDIIRGIKINSHPSYIFSVGADPNSKDLRPWLLQLFPDTMFFPPASRWSSLAFIVLFDS